MKKTLALLLLTCVAAGSAACEKKDAAKADKADTAGKDKAAPPGDASKVMGDKGTQPPAPAPADGPAGAKPEGQAPGGDPKVELVSPGNEPRTALRFALTAGTTQSAEMTMTMGMAMQLGPNSPPAMDLPPIVMTMDAKVAEVNADKSFKLEYTVSKADVALVAGANPQVVEALRGSVGGMVGMSGWVTTTDRGFNRGGDVSLPAGAPAELGQMMGSFKDSMQQMSAPFPEEAVGVGGSWTSTLVANANGVTVDQKATYEVLEINGTQVKLRYTVTQTGRPGPVNAPGMPPGASAELISLTSEGSGEIVVDTAKPLPQAEMNLAMDMKMTVSAAGQKQDMGMQMKLGIKLQ